MALIARPGTELVEYNTDEFLVKFATYTNYLKNINKFIYNQYKGKNAFGEILVDETKKFRPLEDLDTALLEKWLKLAWNTEFLLYISNMNHDTDILRINNHWMPVLTYYSIYSSLIAFCYSNGSEASNHSNALRIATNILVERGIPPWNLAFQGPPGRKDNEHVPKNFPKTIDWKNLPSNLQTHGVEPIEMIAVCLRAEHIHRRDDIWSDVKKVKKRKQRKYQIAPSYTGILHFLYRLRKRSNYDSPDIFTADAPPDDIADFSSSLKEICYWSLLYMEAIMIRRIGKDKFIDIADRYFKKNNDAGGLEERMNIYKRNF